MTAAVAVAGGIGPVTAGGGGGEVCRWQGSGPPVDKAYSGVSTKYLCIIHNNNE